MLLFYDTQITAATQEFTFDRAESKHLTKVLRKKSEPKSPLQMEKDFNGLENLASFPSKGLCRKN